MSWWRTSELLLDSPRGGVESLDHKHCAPHHQIQDCFPPQIAAGCHDHVVNKNRRIHRRAILVWVPTATSLPCSVSSRVCQTWVRRPRCTGVAIAITVIPSSAPPMKLVLLSIVVVPFASSGKLITVAAAPTESASAMIAPP